MWSKGRQNTGYEKIKLISCSWPVLFDSYLIRYRIGDGIPPHVDEVSSGEHHRLNIVLWGAGEGGEFICDSTLYESPRIKYFRPDIAEHSVTKVTKGSRYVLSIGWLKK